MDSWPYVPGYSAFQTQTLCGPKCSIKYIRFSQRALESSVVVCHCQAVQLKFRKCEIRRSVLRHHKGLSILSLICHQLEEVLGDLRHPGRKMYDLFWYCKHIRVLVVHVHNFANQILWLFHNQSIVYGIIYMNIWSNVSF